VLHVWHDWIFKGVIYSHRALVLHSLAECAADAFAVRPPRHNPANAPMFPRECVGLAFSCTMAGASCC